MDSLTNDSSNVSDLARAQRVQEEFMRAELKLQNIGRAVACYGSARTKPEDPLYKQAVDTGNLLAIRGVATITGGGPGIMEAANKGAFEAKGTSVGLCIDLPFEDENIYLTHQLVFKYLFVRKTIFERFAGSAIVFPGGFGTLDELFELLTLVQTDKVKNRPIVLFGSTYWSGLLSWLDSSPLHDGYISASDIDRVPITDSVEEAVQIALS